MAKRKRRLSKKKKKRVLLIKTALFIAALVFIGAFFYFFFASGETSALPVDKAVEKAYISVGGEAGRIEKTLDGKGNLTFFIEIPLSKTTKFKKNLKKYLSSEAKLTFLPLRKKELIKVETPKELYKIVLSPAKGKFGGIKKKKKLLSKQYEEPVKHKEIPKKRKRKKIKGQPILAIIIDDCGIGHMDAFEKALTIPYPITFAVLPFRTYSKKCAYLANGKGYEVILHMPMEPQSYPSANPGPGAIMHSDDAELIVKKLNAAFKNVPFAAGFNNHMGSLITQSRFAVRVMLSYAKKHKKFFIDSRTTAKTVVEEEARKIDCPVLSRDVFLDNIVDYKHINARLDEAVKKAYEHGYAVAIGHNYPATVNVLKKRMPELDKKVNFVFVKDLINGEY